MKPTSRVTSKSWVFKSPGLLCSEVRELGLTLGVVKVLFDNVGKYDKYLASQNH
ncbi:hypothetical protein VP01_1101g4 [Puccinia sorghi]|uniref:Uncharacterized protein n=1 Tax=Puccinia sorghi TaxID=27349 RepID=A0A0L6VSU5_9BASI|nr:hypothetical protein VP01_1101g4 [Puccinia sorghi]